MRGKQAPQRKIEPDAVYNSIDVAKFVNYVMKDGKKSTARKVVYSALEKLGKLTKAKPVEAFDRALGNVKPVIEVRSKRVGGSNFQVPVPVNEKRQFGLASKWIIEAARSSRGSRGFDESLAEELAAAYNKEGNAMRKKEEVKKMADANKAFAQFA